MGTVVTMVMAKDLLNLILNPIMVITDTVDMVLVTVMEVSITEVTTVITWANVLLILNLTILVTDMVDTVLDTVTVMVVMEVTTGAKLTDQNLPFLTPKHFFTYYPG